MSERIIIVIVLAAILFKNDLINLKNEIDEHTNQQTEKLIEHIEMKWSKYFVDKIKPLLHDGKPVDIKINHIMQVNTPENDIEVTYRMIEVDEIIASSCSTNKGSYIQEIKVPGLLVFPVLCDSILADSGWTVVLRRLDGSVNFNRNWTDYRRGFGDLRTEFFIGLDKLHHMTKWHKHELIVYLKDEKNEIRYAKYSEFQIDNEAAAYALNVLGTYSGNAGDSLSTHINATFSTPDMNAECAKAYKSGWWFKNCMDSNLNGVYESNEVDADLTGIVWSSCQMKPIKFAQMMIRPIYN